MAKRNILIGSAALAAALLAASLIAGCGTLPYGSSTSSVLTYITVSPSSSSMDVGAKKKFTATGYDQNVKVISITPTWVVYGGIGTVTSTGEFTATTDGAGKVRAYIGSVKDEASVTVTDTRVVSVTVLPGTASLRVGDSLPFEATGYTSTGASVSITPSWYVVGGIGTVYLSERMGVFTALTAGSGAVNAYYNGVYGTSAVTVTGSLDVF